jgi:pimeloyl-ACP methyl ester carboxylesterase
MNGPARGGQSLAIHDIQMYFEAAGEGAPLLFLHGFSGIGSDWDYVSAEVPAGYRLILPDLRGHGRSTNPSPEFSFRQSALDVFALLDQLGIDKFQAIGVSGGGQILLHMATQQPSRVDAMVLVSTAHYFPEQARAVMRQMTLETHTEQEWTVMRRRHPQGDDQIRALWRQAHDLRDSFADVNFTPPYLSTITARTLIVQGDRDPLYPIDIACEMYRSIPGARLWIVPNAGHGMIFQKQAPHFVETAVGFLGEQS